MKRLNYSKYVVRLVLINLDSYNKTYDAVLR